MHELTIIDSDRQFSTAFDSFLKKNQTASLKARIIVGAEAARQYVLMHFPDVIIINADSENTNCFDLIRECKRANNPAKFIVVSNEKNFETLQESLRLGVSDFFVKPVDFTLLFDSAERLFKASEYEKREILHSKHDVRPRSDRMFSDLLAGRITTPVELSLRLADANLKSSYINRPCALVNIHINHFSNWLTTCWDSGAERFYRELENTFSGISEKAEFVFARTFYSNIEVLCINNSQVPMEELLDECIPMFSKHIMKKFGIYSEIHVTRTFASLSEIVKYNLQEPVSTDSKSEEIIEKALRYMRHHYFREITLEDVAKYINRSKEYFCSYYKRNTGENFLDTLTRHRIEMSKKLLTNTTLTINQVAESVGYKSSSYFHKTFKNLCGLPPSEYRKKNK